MWSASRETDHRWWMSMCDGIHYPTVSYPYRLLVVGCPLIAPKFQLMNLAPLITTKYDTWYTHANAKTPWFREGEQRGDTSECRQSQGKTIHHHCHHTSPTGAKQKFWCQRLVFRLYPCQESRKFDSSPSSKEANQVILLSFSIQCPWQIWCGIEETTSSITY